LLENIVYVVILERRLLMAFDSLSEKLQNVFKNLRSKGRLTEEDVKAALKEVKMALLEADVNFKVVKNFVKTVQERAVGQDVMNSLTPGQMVIKLVNEELVELMGSETTELALKPSNEITVILMCGLQGAGKTTTTAKIAGKLKQKGRRPLLVACDIYRPAAIEQLKVNGEKQGVEVFSMGTGHKPVDIAKAALEHASANNQNIVILDTAGRLHVDEDMMSELQEIKQGLTVDQTVLVVDSMTGQDAVNVAKTFHEKIEIDGVILTKLDGDTRGGAALSIRAVTGCPILYVGMGEKLSDLEQFYPDRMASRILGMGDVLTLIEKAEAEIDEDKAKEMEKKFRKAEFDFNDFLDQIAQMKKMGGIKSILGMMPNMGLPEDLDIDDDVFKGTEAIIHSMTPEERGNPSLINPSRKKRIAKGAGVDLSEVNKLMKQYEQSRKMMKQMSGMMSGKGKKKGRLGAGMPKMPFGF
jgi:signal recognition particle subunit SRP54